MAATPKRHLALYFCLGIATGLLLSVLLGANVVLPNLFARGDGGSVLMTEVEIAGNSVESMDRGITPNSGLNSSNKTPIPTNTTIQLESITVDGILAVLPEHCTQQSWINPYPMTLTSNPNGSLLRLDHNRTMLDERTLFFVNRMEKTGSTTVLSAMNLLWHHYSQSTANIANGMGYFDSAHYPRGNPVERFSDTPHTSDHYDRFLQSLEGYLTVSQLQNIWPRVLMPHSPLHTDLKRTVDFVHKFIRSAPETFHRSRKKYTKDIREIQDARDQGKWKDSPVWVGFLTTVRNPVDRLVSQYYYLRGMSKGVGNLNKFRTRKKWTTEDMFRNTRNLTFSQCVSALDSGDNPCKFGINVMTKWFCGRDRQLCDYRSIDAGNNTAAVEMAKVNLSKLYAWIGSVEFRVQSMVWFWIKFRSMYTHGSHDGSNDSQSGELSEIRLLLRIIGYPNMEQLKQQHYSSKSLKPKSYPEPSEYETKVLTRLNQLDLHLFNWFQQQMESCVNPVFNHILSLL